MNRALIIGVVGYLSVGASSVFAYEPGTHGQLSDTAAQQSVLVVPLPWTNTTVLQDLGLTSYFDTSTSKELPDIQDQSNDWVYSDPDKKSPFIGNSPLSIQLLIETGAQLEDLGSRPLNHFYDPAHSSGLTLAGVQIGVSTPLWAQDSTCSSSSQSGPYDPSGSDSSSSNQCFSISDATSYFTNALTASDPNVRKQQFGDLFLTLGHIMHLVQDMAQPQHVRNDMHCDEDACLLVGLKNPSLYETYVYNSTSKLQEPDFAKDFATYPTQTISVVNLPTAQAYWSAAGFGLADFTNSNFVSAGTNFTVLAGSNTPIPSSNYAFPKPSGITTESINAVYQDFGQAVPDGLAAYCSSLQAPLTCSVTMVQTQVNDVNYTAPGCATVAGLHTPTVPDTSCVNMHASTYSIFEPDLASENPGQGQPVDGFTLNADNFQSAMNYLLPRAIGYSAGLINYFFRGRLGVQPDPNNINNYIVSNLGGYELKGSIEFYYDDPDGNRYPITGSKTTVDLPGFASGSQTPSTQSIPVVLPAYPQTQASGNFMAVFNGNIGIEPGIAGKQFADDFYLFDDDSHLYSGLAQAYSGPGVLINEFTLGVPDAYQITMAASGGSVYASGANLSAPSGTPGYMVVRDGDPIVTGIDFPDDIAVNDNNLFVITNTTGSESIATYDLAGNPAPPSSLSSLSIPDQAVMGMGANDNVICITGLDENGAGQDLLYNLSTGAELPALKAAPDGFDRCAVTSDRVYVVRQLSNGDTGPINVDVYDNNGSPVATFPIDGETYSFGIAATDKRVYVQVWDNNGTVSPANPSGYEQGVVIYQRNPTTDTFTLLGKIWVSRNNGSEIIRDIAIDMKNVIAAGDH